MEDYSQATQLANTFSEFSGLDTNDYTCGKEDRYPKIKRENDDSPTGESSPQSINNIKDFCDEDQTILAIDSKKNITLCKDQMCKINYIREDRIRDPPICNHNEQLNDLDIKITHCIEQNIQTHLKLDDFQKSLTLLLHQIGNESGMFNVETNDEEDSHKTSTPPLSKLDEIDEKISHCMSSNKRTHSKIDNLQNALDLVLKYFESNSKGPISANEAPQMFHFPISTLNEFNKLDRELNDYPNLMSDLVKKFTEVAGDSGNKSAKKVGIKIIEKIISPKLLIKFSWTGRTFGSNQKIPFMNYCSIFKLCLQVISKADRSFDAIKLENFLKKSVLKHSSQRLARKYIGIKPKSKALILNAQLVDGVSSGKSECFSHNEQSIVSEQESYIEEVASAEEITIDSKENIMNCLVDPNESDNKTKEDKNVPSLSPNPFLKKCNHEDKLNGMDRKISTCIESNVQMHSKLDHMQQTLQLILDSIGNGRDLGSASGQRQGTIPDVVDDVLDSFRFPLATVLDLKNLNRKLSINENFESKMTNKIISFVGNPKGISLQRFGLEVVEYVISPQLLMKYTWTGRSRGNKPKLAMMKYRSVVSLFQRVISKADDSFNRKECEDFLKCTVLKYTKLRVIRRGKYNFDEDYNNQDIKTTRPNFEEIPLDLEETYETKYKRENELNGEDGNHNFDSDVP